MRESQIPAIKARLGTVRDVLSAHNVEIKGSKFRCINPEHEDKHPSGGLYEGDQKWRCPPCGAGGDCISAWAMLHGMSNGEAVKALAGEDAPARPAKRKPAADKPKLTVPTLSQGDPATWKALGDLRRLNPDAVKIACERGLVGFAAIKGHEAWVITDSRRLNAQARRMDGGTWAHIGDAKAYTLPGSRAAWPVGLPETDDYPVIALVEGGPDLLAAYHFIIRERQTEYAAPVAILGASNNIPDEALPLFAEHWVRVFPHCDEKGMKAGIRWARSIKTANHATTDIFDASDAGEGISDLNDLASVAETLNVQVLP